MPELMVSEHMSLHEEVMQHMVNIYMIQMNI